MNQTALKFLFTMALSLGATSSYASSGNVEDRLVEAKFSLLDAVAKAEALSGPAISAKFELDDTGELVYSVYTVPQGIDKLAEEVDLTEVSGSATQIPISLKTEIFADKEHISRAASQLTVMQMSYLSLREAIERALMAQPGIAFDVHNPTVRTHRPVADVMIRTTDRHVITVTIDLISGKRI